MTLFSPPKCEPALLESGDAISTIRPTRYGWHFVAYSTRAVEFASASWKSFWRVISPRWRIGQGLNRKSLISTIGIGGRRLCRLNSSPVGRPLRPRLTPSLPLQRTWAAPPACGLKFEEPSESRFQILRVFWRRKSFPDARYITTPKNLDLDP
jgi:hypothetical protein